MVPTVEAKALKLAELPPTSETLSVYIMETFKVVVFKAEELLLEELETMTVPTLEEF